MVKKNGSVVGKLLCQIDRRVPIADDADHRMMVGGLCWLEVGDDDY